MGCTVVTRTIMMSRCQQAQEKDMNPFNVSKEYKLNCMRMARHSNKETGSVLTRRASLVVFKACMKKHFCRWYHPNTVQVLLSQQEAPLWQTEWWSPKDVHVLTLGTCEYVPYMTKGRLQMWLQLKDLRGRDYLVLSSWAESNHMSP